MPTQKQFVIAAFLGLAFGITEVEAKRVGGGRTSGASRPAATKSTAKDEKPTAKKEEESDSSGPGINIRLPRGSSSTQAPGLGAAQNAAPAAIPAAAAAGAAAGAASAASAATAAPDLDAQARRKESAEKLARAIAEEEKRAAAIKAYEREQAEREKQLAREKEARDARRARAAYESQCQFKAVMTDEDIARCRSVYKR